MKRIIVLTTMMILCAWGLKAQNNGQTQEMIRMPLLGEEAPSFTAQSTTGQVNFPGDYFGKWKILFSHPADFTAVCSSEILSLATMQEDFDKLNTQIVVVSTDGLNSHISWVKSLETMNADNIPNFKIKFPLVSDQGFELSKKYGMIQQNSTSTKDIRSVFIISPENKICAVFSYPSNVGRNLEEIKRTLIALQTSDKHSCLMPVNWHPGEKVMIPSPKNMEEAEKLSQSKNKNLTSPIWYMWYKSID
ncbi:MAG: peroxiredoxin [Bacteroidetes bacterium]|nr:peroxiredoxin [Bacteroidota bacterium]